ncbi:MAG: hypothetical protein RLZ12_240 [Bacillota bacterium]|jgi:hypothetical protein
MPPKKRVTKTKVISKKKNRLASSLELIINNKTGLSDPIYVTIVGLSPITLCPNSKPGQYVPVWGDLAGNVHAIKQGQTIKDFAQPFKMGAKYYLPPIRSGRIYFSVGKPLEGAPYNGVCNGGGVPTPAANNNTDPSYNTIWDFFEYTYFGDSSLGVACFNTSLVNGFGIPYNIELVGEQGEKKSGQLLFCRQELFKQFESLGSPFADQIVKHEGTYIRIIGPNLGVSTNPGYGTQFPQDFFTTYIDRVWKQYKNNWKLYLTNLKPGVDATGEIVASMGRDVFQFKATNGSTYNIQKPTSNEVFQCNGVFVQTGSDPVDGTIKAVFAAMFNRTNLLVQNAGAHQCDKSTFYLNAPVNEYAKMVHDLSLNGFNYAFPYDDVCDYSSTICDPNPTCLTINLQPFN